MPIERTGRPVPPEPVQRAIWQEEAARGMEAAVAEAHGAVVREMEPNRKTGTSMRSVASEVLIEGDAVVGRVGTNYRPVKYLDRGTGLWGPHHQVIRPVHARALRFPQPGNKGFTLAGRQRSGKAGTGARFVYAKWVRGVQPRRYFELAAAQARPRVLGHMRAAGQRMVARLGGAA